MLKQKTQSPQLLGKLSPRQKGVPKSLNVKMILFIFFDWIGAIHHEYVPCGHTVKEFYLDVLQCLKET